MNRRTDTNKVEYDRSTGRGTFECMRPYDTQVEEEDEEEPKLERSIGIGVSWSCELVL